MQSLRQKKTSESSYTSGEKSFSLKEHDEEFGKQEEIFGVCLPSASAWASSPDRGGRADFETVWLQRSNHFFPFLFLILSHSSSLCTHTHTTLCSAWFLPALLWIPMSRTKDEIYCRRTVCANREGRCTWLSRDDWIMMSSGNISAFSTLKSSFPPQLAHKPTQAIIVTWQQCDYFVF